MFQIEWSDSSSTPSLSKIFWKKTRKKQKVLRKCVNTNDSSLSCDGIFQNKNLRIYLSCCKIWVWPKQHEKWECLKRRGPFWAGFLNKTMKPQWKMQTQGFKENLHLKGKGCLLLEFRWKNCNFGIIFQVVVQILHTKGWFALLLVAW